MPSYAYRCECGASKVVFYPTLPSEAKQNAAACDVCDKQAKRSIADEGFFAVGGQNGGVEKAVGMAAERDAANGRPIYHDENGKIHEIRSSKDIDSFSRHNALGRTIYTDKLVRDKDGTMVPAPARGANGQVLRESEQLTPLDGGGEWTPPSETATGRPIKNGAIVQGPTKTATGEDAWGSRQSGEPDVREVGVRRPPPGKKWS